ncbi:hypothetical protein ElyMa_003176800 [Elysia marginata]|uniref:Uncharacterized protein n=1 Tax=Elysia marginata TaxID=1093978 RepID=A0AAV4IZA6_9GAST|nr:hypothetical protein ElyMa_003176800 [Elysia marginata]
MVTGPSDRQTRTGNGLRIKLPSPGAAGEKYGFDLTRRKLRNNFGRRKFKGILPGKQRGVRGRKGHIEGLFNSKHRQLWELRSVEKGPELSPYSLKTNPVRGQRRRQGDINPCKANAPALSTLPTL